MYTLYSSELQFPLDSWYDIADVKRALAPQAEMLAMSGCSLCHDDDTGHTDQCWQFDDLRDFLTSV